MALYDIFKETDLAIGLKVKDKLLKYKDCYSSLFELDFEDTRLNAYYIYPCMFREDFPEMDEDLFVDLSVCGILYFKYIITFDKQLDGDLVPNVNELFYNSFLAQESIKALVKFLNPHEEFYFKKMNEYVGEYIRALKSEKQLCRDYQEYTYVLKGKSAVAKCFVAAMAIKTGRDEKIALLEGSQDCFYEAFQLLDDFKDIKQDLNAERHTWLTDQVNKEEGNYYSQLHKANGIEKVFQLINYNCDRAIGKAGRGEGWLKNIYLLKSKAQMIYGDIMQKNFNANYSVAKEKVNIYSLDELVNKMDSFLRKTYANGGFSQIVHHMVFPASEGYQSDINQASDTFTRAYLLNILNDLTYFGTQLKEIENPRYIDFLLQNVTKFYKAGWSYFPNLKELAPDIDTLSEVIKFANYTKDEALCIKVNEAIDFVLANCVKEDGSIDTWLLSSDNPSEQEKYAIEFANQRWKIRQDPEVVANFIHAISLYEQYNKDIKKYVEKGIEYLKKCQNEDGFWYSSWYCGKMYGTYVCARAIIQNNKSDEIIDEILENILELFDEDGRYKDDFVINDYLYCILILIDLIKCKSIRNVKINNILENVAVYLSGMLDEEEGFIGSSPFVKVAEVKYEDSGQIYKYVLSYESILLTSSISLKICSEIKKLLQE